MSGRSACTPFGDEARAPRVPLIPARNFSFLEQRLSKMTHQNTEGVTYRRVHARVVVLFEQF